MTSQDGPDDRGHDEANSEEGSSGPPPDCVFRALSDGMRRWILLYLLTQKETTTEALTDVVHEQRAETDGMGRKEREQVAIELRHVHLPKLEQASLIEYDSDTGEISLRAVPHEIRTLLRKEFDRATSDGDRHP